MVITILWLFIWFIAWLLVDELLEKGKSNSYDLTPWFIILFLLNNLWGAHSLIDIQEKSYQNALYVIECKSVVVLLNVKKQGILLDEILEGF